MKLSYLFSVSILVVLLISTDLYAQNYQLNANYFIRSSPHFRDQSRNRVGVLTAGSTFRVISRVRRGDRAYAAQIEIISRARNSNVRSSRTQWIYMSGRSHFTRLQDPASTEAAVPQVTNTNSPECEGCAINTTAPSNANDIAQVNQAITQTENTTDSPTTVSIDAAPAPAVVAATPAAPANATESANSFGGPLATQIDNYSKSQEVANMISWATKNKKIKSIGLCYRLVKEAIANQCGSDIIKRGRVYYHCRNPFAPKGGRTGPGNNLTPAWFGDNRAYNGKNTLKQFGFVNLLEREPYKSQIGNSPAKAPKGAVLVYSSGRICRGSKPGSGDCGHIEIKTSSGDNPSYVSDFSIPNGINETPNARRNGTRYRLVGVMIKPGVQ